MLPASFPYPQDFILGDKEAYDENFKVKWFCYLNYFCSYKGRLFKANASVLSLSIFSNQ